MTQLGVQGGIGISAEPAVTNASDTPTSNNNFFNMLKSPRVFELNSVNFRIHGKIKSWRTVHVKTPRDFLKPEHFEAAAIGKRCGTSAFLLKGFGV
jgi:hypothetical protein